MEGVLAGAVTGPIVHTTANKKLNEAVKGGNLARQHHSFKRNPKRARQVWKHEIDKWDNDDDYADKAKQRAFQRAQEEAKT